MMTDPQQQAIQRLKDLVAATHKGLEVAEGYGEQANALVSKCKLACEKLELAYTKLDLISNEIAKQLHVISQIIMQLKKRNNELHHQIEKLQITDQEVAVGLVDIFKKLMERQVDPNLVASGGDGVKTLHDFVDTVAVDTLRSQASQELGDMRRLQQLGERTIVDMERRYHELTEASKGQIVRQDIVRPTYGTDKMALQRNEANIISALLLDITTLHDRVQNAARGKVHIDIVGLESRTEGLSIQLSRMHDALMRMSNHVAEVESRLPRTASAYKGAAGILHTLERFGGDLNVQLQSFQQIEDSSKVHNASIQFLQEELANLVTWYGLFHTAYHELIYEIDRRHKYMKSQQDVVDAYSRELKSMWQTENQKRTNFFEYHGRYLPPSLCPAITEQTTRFQILPEHLSTNLPPLSTPLNPTSSLTNSAANNIAYSLERLHLVGGNDPPNSSAPQTFPPQPPHYVS